MRSIRTFASGSRSAVGESVEPRSSTMNDPSTGSGRTDEAKVTFTKKSKQAEADHEPTHSATTGTGTGVCSGYV